MNPELLERYWRDPAHWQKGIYYRCAEDPRLIVPKKKKWHGWTLNFARPMAIPALLLMMVFVASPLVALAYYGYDPRTLIWWVGLIIVLVILSGISAYAASPRRFSKKPTNS